MKQPAPTGFLRERLGGRRRHLGSISRVALVASLTILAAYLLWPYATLWHLNTAVRSADLNNLSDLIDLDAVRQEIKRKLNKDSDSSIDMLSEPFIRWIERGIQTMGSEAVDRQVTLEWVRNRLLAHSPADPDTGFLGQIAYAFFDSPAAFRLSIGRGIANPVQVRLRLDGFSWRIKAVYY